jgi:hypothetical protein
MYLLFPPESYSLFLSFGQPVLKSLLTSEAAKFVKGLLVKAPGISEQINQLIELQLKQIASPLQQGFNHRTYAYEQIKQRDIEEAQDSFVKAKDCFVSVKDGCNDFIPKRFEAYRHQIASYANFGIAECNFIRGKEYKEYLKKSCKHALETIESTEIARMNGDTQAMRLTGIEYIEVQREYIPSDIGSDESYSSFYYPLLPAHMLNLEKVVGETFSICALASINFLESAIEKQVERLGMGDSVHYSIVKGQRTINVEQYAEATASSMRIDSSCRYIRRKDGFLDSL